MLTESESISQKHGSEDPDPDPPQNVMDPEHRLDRQDVMTEQYTNQMF